MILDSSLTILRCRAAAIERALWESYFDAPICYFSGRLVRATAKWFARSDHVYFMMALVSGERAGFVHGHTMGLHPWRVFARQHPCLLPQLLWLRVRMKQPASSDPSHSRGARAGQAQADPENVAALALPVTDTPFQWGASGARTGYIELVSVAQPFRGQGLAPLLLEATWREMESRRRPLGRGPHRLGQLRLTACFFESGLENGADGVGRLPRQHRVGRCRMGSACGSNCSRLRRF